MNCPKCKAEIEYLDFCGDDYFGRYNFAEEYKFNFTCPECHKVILQIRKKFTENELTNKLDENRLGDMV